MLEQKAGTYLLTDPDHSSLEFGARANHESLTCTSHQDTTKARGTLHAEATGIFNLQIAATLDLILDNLNDQRELPSSQAQPTSEVHVLVQGRAFLQVQPISREILKGNWRAAMWLASDM